ncbi:MAG: PAS domain-containing protein, partial [Phycisphaerae bacterium]
RAVHEGQPLRTQEYSLPSPRGERFYEYRMVRSGPGEVLSIVRDVTDRTRSEQRLKESEARFRTLAENSPEMLGREPEDLLANEWLRFIHPADTSRVAARWVECVHEERVFQEEYRWVTPEGGVVFTLGLAGPIRQSGQVVGFVGTLVDVTELRRLEEEVIEIDRRERERIGQDLHDVLGQQLTGIGLLLESLKEQENYNESAAQGVMGRIQEAVRMASAHIRFLARGMLPLGTEDSRIEDALADLVENARALFPVECDLRVASGPIRRAAAVGGDLVENLYHIAQEAVTNGVRHGRATRILVTLEEQGDDIVMTVTDDGEGMVESTEESSGIGVKIMHNRIRLLGGSLTIGRVPETGGTFVEARVPTADTAGTESLSG